MADVGKWLDSLDLGRYAGAFEENAIDWEALRKLDHELLREIGVKAVGHRLTILEAIEGLSGGPEGRPRADAADTDSESPASEAERRQLTVMFSDMIGSTDLSRRLDPEDLRDVNRAYQEAVRDAVEQFGGYVARYMGDGVLAYFGYPRAHEDDAERAVRAGLAVVESVRDLAASTTVEVAEPLAVRVGIATGPVVVGDLIGEGASRESAAVGETLNLAARIQAECEANAVTVAGATRELVAGLFVCEEIGTRPLRGFGGDQRLWRVTGGVRSGSRFEALRSRSLTSFVGRESELGMLLNRWESAVAGEGQLVLVEGEAGIGKSRLADELRRAVAPGSHTCIRFQCSPHRTNSAFFPFASQLEYASGIVSGDAVDARLDKLERLLPDSSPERERTLWLFAKLLSLPGDRYPELTLEPQELKLETIEAFRRQLVEHCARAPVLMMFEDLHWMDPTSLEVLDVLIRASRDLPVLVILTHRPEFESSWDSHGFVTRLQLNRLPRRDGVVLVQEVAGGKTLPDAIVEQILVKADGVALFVEELTRSVLKDGLLHEGGASRGIDDPLPDLAIPSSLSDSLVARLDRLGAAKEVAQVAACIGREFSFELLHPVAGLGEEQTRQALRKLEDEELVHGHGAPGRSSYVFKHTLVQEAAYQSLLKRTRREYHRRIADALEAGRPEALGGQEELLAHHCTRAELYERALAHWRRAGESAFSRHANREAARSFDRALTVLERLPETEDTLAAGIDIRVALRHALFPLGQFGEIMERLQEAERLAGALGDRHRLALVTCYLCQATAAAGDCPRAIALGEKALGMAETRADVNLRVAAMFFLAHSHSLAGSYLQSSGYARRVVDSLTGPDVYEHFGLFGLPSVMARSRLSASLSELGRLAESRSVARETMHIAEESDHPLSIGIALCCVARVAVIDGRLDDAIASLERATALCRRWDLTYYFPNAAASLGRAYCLSGRPGDGQSILDEVARHEGVMADEHCATGEGFLLAGEIDRASEHARRALELSVERKERGHEAWALHLAARIASDPERAAAAVAERCYEQALSLARELGMRMLQAHCHLGLAALYEGSGRAREGRAQRDTGTALFGEIGMRPPARIAPMPETGRSP